MLSTLNHKGQATILQALLQQLGSVPGQAVPFGLGADANCITAPATPGASIAHPRFWHGQSQRPPYRPIGMLPSCSNREAAHPLLEKKSG